MLNLGFSDKGALYNPSHFAASLPDDVPIVLVFGAQAVEGLRLEDHPYVRSCFTCFLLCLLDLYFCDLCSLHFYLSIELICVFSLPFLCFLFYYFRLCLLFIFYYCSYKTSSRYLSTHWVVWSPWTECLGLSNLIGELRKIWEIVYRWLGGSG